MLKNAGLARPLQVKKRRRKGRGKKAAISPGASNRELYPSGAALRLRVRDGSYKKSNWMDGSPSQ